MRRETCDGVLRQGDKLKIKKRHIDYLIREVQDMEIFETVMQMGHEQVVFCNEPKTGLKAIIAIHNTKLGPALGGCRFWDYKSDEEAITDVLRLSRGMTYKAAVAGLRLGGGKSVIIGDPTKLKSPDFFKAFGRFVHSLNGRYITAEDVNIKVADMDYVASETPYVTGVSSRTGGSGDPSPVTAWGVFYGLKAAVKQKLKTDSLQDLRVAVQGIGSVGRNLCDYLHNEGAKLVIADINKEAVADLASKYDATIMDPESIHTAEVDVFAPCALGGILNDNTIDQIKATIIAGGANNQLMDEDKHGEALRSKGILYSPDYVINAGGLINVAHELKGYIKQDAIKEAEGIYDTMLEIFDIAEKENIPTHVASDRLAEARVEKDGAGHLQNTFDNQDWIQVGK